MLQVLTKSFNFIVWQQLTYIIDNNKYLLDFYLHSSSNESIYASKVHQLQLFQQKMPIINNNIYKIIKQIRIRKNHI